MYPVYYVNDVTGLHPILILPLRGRTEVGVGHQSSRTANLTFPFAPKEIPLGDKGESKRSGEGAPGMGMGVLISMLEIATSR